MCQRLSYQGLDNVEEEKKGIVTREIDKFRETMKIREAEKEEQDKKRNKSKSPARKKSRSRERDRERDSESRSRCSSTILTTKYWWCRFLIFCRANI